LNEGDVGFDTLATCNYVCAVRGTADMAQHAASVESDPDRKSHSPIRSPRRQWRAVCRGREAERFGGLEVDHQLKSGGELHREISGLRALEDNRLQTSPRDLLCRALLRGC
jgi:hypothetical protein